MTAFAIISGTTSHAPIDDAIRAPRINRVIPQSHSLLILLAGLLIKPDHSPIIGAGVDALAVHSDNGDPAIVLRAGR